MRNYDLLLTIHITEEKNSACKRHWLYWEYLHWQRSSVPSYYSCIDLPHEEHSLHSHSVICHQCIPAVVLHKSGWLERMLPPGTIMHMPLPTQHFGVWNIVSNWDRERQCYFLCVNMSRLGSPWSFPSLPRVCLTLNYIMYLCQWQMTVKVLSCQQIQQSVGPQYARGKEWRNPQGRSRAKLQLPSFIFMLL